MKEPVRKTKHPWGAGVCVAVIAALYFSLLARSDFPEPGRNVVLDDSAWRNVDEIETRYAETGQIALTVPEPHALAVGPAGRLYVAGKGTIAIFNENGVEEGQIDINGTPNCLTVAADKTIFLGIRDHVEVLDSTGAVEAVWENLGDRAYITSIAASKDAVFVADMGNRVVYKYNWAGALQRRIGEADEAQDVPGLEAPSPYMDVALDDSGLLWVVNPGLLGLECYRSSGEFVTSWYRQSFKLDGFSGCCNPAHIAFDADGRLITLEKGLARVKVYDAGLGAFTELVAGSKHFSDGHKVKDLAVDARNRILVLDLHANAVRIFELKEGSHEQITEST